MSHNNLEKSGAVRLQVFLVKATSLTHLNLSNCCLGTDGMIVSVSFPIAHFPVLLPLAALIILLNICLHLYCSTASDQMRNYLLLQLAARVSVFGLKTWDYCAIFSNFNIRH